MQSTDLEEIKAALAVGASLSSVYTCQLGNGTGDGSEIQPGAIECNASSTVALASGFRGDHF